MGILKKRRATVAIVLVAVATSTAANAQNSQWDSILSNSNWYVPVPNLVAYTSGSVSFYRPPPAPFGDQTLWSIGQSINGAFSGQSQTAFYLGGSTTVSNQTLQGMVTPSGQIVIMFAPSGGPTTVGIGQFRSINGIPEMEMQMITGASGLNITHWAYMVPYNPALFTPPSPSQFVTANITSPQYNWTAGTTWRFVSPTLFGSSAPGTFKISNYSNGYYWGLGAAPPGSAVGNFTILGSITPEGNLVFSTLSGEQLTSFSGLVTGDASSANMAMQAYNINGPYGTVSVAGFMPVSTVNLGQTFFISNVGSTVIPAFTGGTLQVDTIGQTYSQNFTVDGSPTNTIDQRGGSAVLSGVLSDAVPGTPGRLTIANSEVGGYIALTGANTYTGPTLVQAGATLLVNGSLVSPLTVAGTLGGSGVVGNTTIAPGGVLAPGNSIGTLTVKGNLAFAPGSLYLIEAAPGAADRTNVSGSASIQGSAIASFASGNYTPTPQVVLSAAGGISGSFGNLVTLGLPPGLLASLSYTPTNVQLNLTSVLGTGTSLTGNQSAVAGAINTGFNTGNSLPGTMASLFNQTGQTLASSLGTLSGEAQTGVQATVFGYGNLFLNSVLAAGTGAGSVGAQHSAQYASLTATETASVPSRLRGWLTGFGGYGWLGGTTGTGSSGVQSTATGIAAGADLSFDQGVVGVAVSGGTSNWFLDNSLGGGRTNSFQAGLYGRATLDPFYVAAATAWGLHNVSVQRPVPFLGDWLNSNYTATTWSGRLEAGHRFTLQGNGVTPFVAGQSQLLTLPGICETSQTNSGAGLCFNANAAWSVRSEIGAEFEANIGSLLGSKAGLTARLSWAHEYEKTGTASAWFQSLPGSNFSVSGTPLPSDVGIVRVTTNVALDEAWSMRLQADAEFGNNYGAVAGTLRLARRF